MKKSNILFLALTIMLAAGGCAAKTASPVPVLGESGKCLVTYGDSHYSCVIRFLGEDIETLTIEEPLSLRGMSFRKTGEGISIAYSSLICRSQRQLLPEGSFPGAAAAAVHDLRKNSPDLKSEPRGKGYVFSSDSYTLKTDENGVIEEIIL